MDVGVERFFAFFGVDKVGEGVWMDVMSVTRVSRSDRWLREKWNGVDVVVRIR